MIGRRIREAATLLAALVPTAVPAQTLYPSGPAIPANHLRFHVQLTEPASAEAIRTSIRFEDADGQDLRFRLLDEIIVAADGRMVTLFIHPAFIKHALQAKEQSGQALLPNQRVSLEVMGVRRTWDVIPPREDPIATGSWRGGAITPGTQDPLEVQLDRPIDILSRDLIAVADRQGRRIGGRAELLPGETVWRFTPHAPWPEGPLALRIRADLEDAAGNRICTAFEQQSLSRARCADQSYPIRLHASRGQARRAELDGALAPRDVHRVAERARP